MRSLLLALVLAGSLHAQRVRVVDIVGGTPYPQIQAAIDAANPGDIIRINPGVYDPFVCSKPLRIDGGPGVVIAESFAQRAIRITAIPLGTTCSVSELALRSAMTPCICEPGVGVDACAGLVTLDAIHPDPSSFEPTLNVQTAAGVLVRDSRLGPVTLWSSEVHLDGVTVGRASNSQGALIRATDSEVEMTDGALLINFPGSVPGFGLDLDNSHARLRVMDGLQLFRGGPSFHDFRVDATSSLVYDPATTFTPAGVPTAWPFGTPGPSMSRALPTVRVNSAPPGGQVQIEMRHSEAGSAVCPFLAAPGTPVTLPLIEGGLFFGPAFAVLLGCFGTGAGKVTTTLAVPNQTYLSGQVLVVQGVGVAGSLVATNAALLRIE